MKLSPTVFSLLLAGLGSQPAPADPLYKWRDGAGRVTYSSFPPAAGTRAETLPLPPQPSAEDVRQAADRAKRAEEQVRALEQRRLQREAEASEAARLRALQAPPAPIVIEKPIYVPQPLYYPPVTRPPKRHPDHSHRPTGPDTPREAR